MRSNNLGRHKKTHKKYMPKQEDTNEEMCKELVMSLVDNVLEKTSEETRTITSRSEVQSEERHGSKRTFDDISQNSTKLFSINVEALEQFLLKNSREYCEKIKLGEEIFKILGKGKIEPESLIHEYKEALDFYIKQRPRTDYTNVNLRPWQNELLSHITNLTDRKVIWVIGAKCGEGKSWFQDYVESLYGFNRVVAGMNIKVNTASLCHALQKRPLATTDIFMFNIGKSKTKYEEVNYELLEQIKDGRVFASKYNSQELKFKVPNTVVIFSNNAPDIKELAKDRWEIFSIECDELVERRITESWPPVILSSKKKKKPCNSDNDTDSDW